MTEALALLRIFIYGVAAIHTIRHRDWLGWLICILFILANVVTSFSFVPSSPYGDLLRIAGAIAVATYLIKGRKR